MGRERELYLFFKEAQKYYNTHLIKWAAKKNQGSNKAGHPKYTQIYITVHISNQTIF